MTNVFNALKKCDQHGSCYRYFQNLAGSIIVGIVLVFASVTFAAEKEKTEAKSQSKTVSQLMADLIKTIKTRNYHWDLTVFNEEGWQTKGYSVQGYPLVYYTCGNHDAKNSSLILSTVHGDEVTPVYFGFRLVEWLKARKKLCESNFIVVAPMVNPDGFMRYTRGTRTNFNKVDLNRNFDTPDWEKKALAIWKSKYKSRRYYPGDKSNSEPEVGFQKWLIDEFSPSKILSIHAPLDFLDYDGPQNGEMAEFTKSYVEACEELKAHVQKAAKSLKFYAYGVFPGSLGNYAGKQRGIPTFTVELPTVKWELAGKYFSDLEESTELFIRQELKEYQPRRMTKKD